MFAPTSAAVKFDLSSTPGQQACSMHVDQGLKTSWSLVERLQHAADQHQPIDQVEETVFRELLASGEVGFNASLDLAGPGDVGPTLTVSADPGSEPDQVLPRLDQSRGRPYLSIFGEIDIERTCYGHDRVEAGPPRRPTPPAATTVFLLAPAMVGHVRGRRRSRRGGSKAGDDPRSGDRRQGVGGSEPGASQRCGGVSRRPSDSGSRS